jgi:hypothetical protein
MLETDYHAQIPDIGYQRVFNVLSNLPDFEAETIVAVMYPLQWRQLPEDDNYVDNLKKSIALFKYCPVLDRDGNLVPLNSLSGEVPWGDCVGLGDSSPVELLP